MQQIGQYHAPDLSLALAFLLTPVLEERNRNDELDEDQPPIESAVEKEVGVVQELEVEVSGYFGGARDVCVEELVNVRHLVALDVLDLDIILEEESPHYSEEEEDEDEGELSVPFLNQVDPHEEASEDDHE